MPGGGKVVVLINTYKCLLWMIFCIEGTYQGIIRLVSGANSLLILCRHLL
jgi:hypothetical protein